MQIVIDIPNSDISLKQNVITLDLHFIDGHICECTYPFKELPEKHGRLIDRSVLFEEYQNLYNGLLCRDCPFFKENSCNIEEWILNQPPILEAEE